ncbi:MAG: thioesterase family protein [Pseudomonadota bacterium]
MSSNPAPIQCRPQAVEAHWIDYNGHMNMAYYLVAFDRAVDEVFDQLGIGAAYTASGEGSVFTREVRVNYLSEALQGDDLHITWQLLDADSKRLHYFQEMTRGSDGELLATSEQLALHVSMSTRRSAPLPEQAAAAIAKLQSAHATLPKPAGRERPLGIVRRAPQ